MKRILIAFISMLLMCNAFAISVGTNEPTTIRAERVEYNLKSATLKTVGKTEITNKSGQKMTLQNSYITKNGKNLSGDDIQIWLGEHVYLESEKVSRDGDVTVAQNATFTACKNCDSYGDAWEITA